MHIDQRLSDDAELTCIEPQLRSVVALLPGPS